MGSISSQGTKISHAKWSAKKKSINKRGDFPGGPAVKTLLCHCRGLQVQCLVKELRSHMLHGAVKKLKGKEKKKSDNTKC